MGSKSDDRSFRDVSMKRSCLLRALIELSVRCHCFFYRADLKKTVKDSFFIYKFMKGGKRDKESC